MESLALGVLSFTMYGTTTEAQICWLGWLAGYVRARVAGCVCLFVVL